MSSATLPALVEHELQPHHRARLPPPVPSRDIEVQFVREGLVDAATDLGVPEPRAYRSYGQRRLLVDLTAERSRETTRSIA